MRKIIPILLLMCMCLLGCSSEKTDTASDTISAENDAAFVASTSESAEETTPAVPTETELSTESETETMTAADTTAVTEEITTTTEVTAETTVTTETAATIETTAAITTVAETTAVTESTTTAASTTAAETATEKVTTTAETTTVTTEETIEPVVEEDYSSIELEGRSLKLTFEDNFDGDTLDETKWERCPEWKRQDLNCYWDNDMSYLDGEGNLILETSYDEAADKYLCGAVRSKGKYEQAYGYFEIRCTVNTVPGYWTAFWLMGESVASINNGGIDGTEIDIMESPYFADKKISHALHWNGYDFYHKSMGQNVSVDIYDGEYHKFSLLWTEDEYVFFADGEETWRTSAEDALGTCEVPLYIKITTETGSWTMPDGGVAGLPDYMKIDYVRAYTEIKE